MNSSMRSRGWVCSVVFTILLSLSVTNVQAGSGASTVPSSLSFGSINVNSFSSPQGFTVMNTGTQKLTIGRVVSSSSNFAVSGPALPLTLQAGQGASFRVVFGPTSSGTFSAAINIQFMRSTRSMSTISVSGTGLAPSPTNSLTLTTAASLPGGTVGTAYTTTLQASGGTTPYSWSLSAGALPAGLTLAAATGTISGTPTAAGTFTFTAKVTDSTVPTAQTATKSFSLTVAAAVTPVQIITSSVPSGQVGTAYPTTLAASGGTTPYSWSISAGALPGGLTLATASGTISGTPTTAGTFSFTVKVTDSTAPTAQTATKSFSITVAAAVTPVQITTNSIPSGQVGTAYTTILAASGGTTPYSWSISSGTLPAGLTMAAASGTISGTPTTAGTFSFAVKVTDSTAPTRQTATQAFSITVAAAVTPMQITTSSIPAGQVGVVFSTMIQASGGTTPYSWSMSSGTLPAGLTMAAASGTISGTPTTAGSFSFTAKVTDSTAPTAQTAAKSFTLTIAAAVAPVQITTSSVPSGQVGTAYTTTLVASGGTTPYSWSISAGALPAGLTLATASGTISGTPTTAGSFSFTAKVTDSTAPTAQTATQSFSITVAAGSAYSVLLNWTASPSSGVAGYNVYRSTVSGSGYAKINSSAVAGLTYADATVVNGQTYYYVTTSVDTSGDESTYSEEVQMVVP